MKKYLPLKIGFSNLLIIIITLFVLVGFNSSENLAYLMVVGTLFIIGILLSIVGFILTITHKKPVNRTFVVLSFILNLLFPLILILFLIANLQDLEKTFL